MALSFFDLATRGPSYNMQKAEKWAFWLFSGDFKVVSGYMAAKGASTAGKALCGLAGLLPETYLHHRCMRSAILAHSPNIYLI